MGVVKPGCVRVGGMLRGTELKPRAGVGHTLFCVRAARHNKTPAGRPHAYLLWSVPVEDL